MFTGIIQSVGEIKSITKSNKDTVLCISAGKLSLVNANLGDSIAVNGVCLTVTKFANECFYADVSNETLQKTTLGNLNKGSKVNLEKSLTLSTPLGGHLVSGHVDGIGNIVKKTLDGKSTRYYFAAPTEILRFIAIKGSITIQGISLTVNNIDNDGFDVSIIPHTEIMTNLGSLQIGDEVNLEIDLIARYVDRLLQSSSNKQELTLDKVREFGF